MAALPIGALAVPQHANSQIVVDAVFDLALVTPLLAAAVLQPVEGCARVRRHMLAGVGANDLPLELENLLAFEGVTDGSLIKAALNPIVGGFLARLDRLAKLSLGIAPAVDRRKAHIEGIGQFDVGCAALTQL